jgi:hypothetical protein
MAPLVAWVTNWADDHWALAKVKRPSYQAWHCAGRQVLRVARFQGGVRITAGVNYSKNPPAGEEKALTRLVSHERPLSRAELAHIQARVGCSAASRTAASSWRTTATGGAGTLTTCPAFR